MSNCKICQSSDLSYYLYGNHNNQRNFRVIKFRVARILAPLLRYWIPEIDSKLLFSPAYRIMRCNSCGYGIHEEQSISVESLQSYYNHLYWQAGGLPEDDESENDSRFLDDKRANGQFRMVTDYLPINNPIALLEIGAGPRFIF